MNSGKTLLVTSIACALSLTVGSAAAAMQNSAAAGAAASYAAPRGGSIVLYDQAGTGTNGAPVQNFEAAFDTYDSEVADDFVVPAGGWTVDGLNFLTTAGDSSSATFDVAIYPDAAGLPAGAPTCTYAGLTAVSGTGPLGGTVELVLPSTCVLPEGTYWFAATANLDFGTGGQIFWSNFAEPAIGNPGVFRNPGDGFGSGCTTFTPTPTCLVGGGQPNFIFQVIGVTGTGPETPAVQLPTLGQWSLVGLGVLVALGGLFGLRRRDLRA